VLEERESKFNGQLRVVRTLGMGTYIQANGLTQSGGIVETLWRSTLKKLRTKKIKSCLILGLGGGTVAKLVRKLWSDTKITGVEIDPLMIELGEKYLGLAADKIITKDAYKDFGKFDLVVVDIYCGDEFPEKFEDEKFLKRLTKNKLVIFNRLYYGDKRPQAVKFGRKLEKIFPRVEWVYPEANLMFICYN